MDPLSDYSSITSTHLDLLTDQAQELLQSIGWTYYTIWEKESTPNPLSGRLLAWSKGGVNNAYESTSELFTCGNFADSVQITKACKMGSSLQHFYKDCNFLPIGLGTIAGVAMASERYQFAFGKELLRQISLLSTYNQQSVPSELQEHFFQTVVCIPLPNGAGVLEMGTEKLVLKGDRVLSRLFYWLVAGTHTREEKILCSANVEEHNDTVKVMQMYGGKAIRDNCSSSASVASSPWPLSADHQKGSSSLTTSTLSNSSHISSMSNEDMLTPFHLSLSLRSLPQHDTQYIQQHFCGDNLLQGNQQQQQWGSLHSSVEDKHKMIESSSGKSKEELPRILNRLSTSSAAASVSSRACKDAVMEEQASDSRLEAESSINRSRFYMATSNAQGGFNNACKKPLHDEWGKMLGLGTAAISSKSAAAGRFCEYAATDDQYTKSMQEAATKDQYINMQPQGVALDYYINMQPQGAGSDDHSMINMQHYVPHNRSAFRSWSRSFFAVPYERTPKKAAKDSFLKTFLKFYLPTHRGSAVRTDHSICMQAGTSGFLQAQEIAQLDHPSGMMMTATNSTPNEAAVNHLYAKRIRRPKQAECYKAPRNRVPNISKDIEDIFDNAPDFQRCYPDLMGECKVYVSLSPGESCDEFASFLTTELQKMRYNAIIISLGCLAEEKDQILCHRSLGLFVLSDSFFRNEGCLIDVLGFKNTQVPMLSLFYTLSMSEFRDEKGRELWRKEWKCWKKGNDNMANWEQAVEILGSCDHIELYNMKDSIMQYVQAVAEAVCHRVPLPVYWSKESSQVQGRIRMCEKVDALFQSKASLVTGGTQVLGMHGIWGAGKSTLGKVLCDFYSPEFGGRVCYVELGSTPLLDSSGVQVQQQKRILQQLFEASADFLEWRVRDSGQANAYMDYCLGEAFKKVFLVVDNIQNSLRSFEEARDLFMRKVPFPRGSKVLLLARSLHTLREFLQPLECLSDNVVQFPSNLLFEFSDQIFHQALVSGLSQSEVEILYKERDKDDIFRYFFPAFCRSRHPLTIKSLAAFSQAGGSVSGDLAYETELSDPHQKESREPPLITWEHNVRILRLIKEEGLLDNVFETLQKSYNLSLNSKEQQFFLDVALYMPSTNIHRLRRLYDDSDELFSTTSKCLRKLKDEALLTFKGREVQMPAVCRCFADQMVQRDLSAQMMYMARETVQWACVCDKVLRASNLDSLQRIAFESCHFVQGDDSYSCFTLDLSSCEHLRVLRLWGNKSEQTIKVQLGTANMLESLEILCNTSPITVTGYFPHVKCFKGDAGNHVIMDPPGLPKSLEVLEIFMPTHLCDLDQYLKQNCVNLDVLRLHSQVSYDIVTNGYNSRGNWIIRCGMIDLSYWINLRELVLEDVRNLRELRGLGMLRNLRVLHLAGLNKVNSLDEIKELGKLEEFHLLECSSLWTLRLPCGNSLRHCCIYGCESLAIICVIKVEKEGEVEEEEEEEVNENRLWLQYDANWWRSLSTNEQLFNPDSHLCDGEQDQWRCFRFDSSTADYDLVPFNSGDHVNKFKVCKCPSLMSIDGLLELTAMQVFEFSQANCSKFPLYWHISDPLDIDITLSSDFPAAGWRVSEFVFERGVRGRAQLCSLEVVQEVGEGMVQELLLELKRRVTALKKLAIRCGDSGKCGCEVHPPSFSLLPKSLKELKYDCPHVLDLSNMDKLGHQLTSLDLQGCKKVKMWPDFSHMSTLSALNLSNTSWSSEKKISKFCP